MTRFLSLLAALLFAGAATAQETPAETDPMTESGMEAVADTTEPEITFDPERSRTLSAEGDALFEAEDYDGALEQYTLGLAYDSTYAKNALGQARSHFRMGDMNAALAAYDMAVELGTGVEGMANIVDRAQSESAQIRENMAEQQSVQAISDKITRATQLLSAEPVSENNAQSAFELMEEARMADYDSSQVAFYYAKALNVLNRSEEAAHYANIAVDQSEGQPDRSAYFIQLGLAEMGLGNTDAAREAFEATQGGAWEAWGTHYLGQLDSDASGSEAGG